MIIIIAIFIGLTMGVFGSGGAILTLPSLIFLMGLEDKVAIVGSLIVVGVIAAVASVYHLVQKSFDSRAYLYFASVSILSSYVGAYVGTFTSGNSQLLVFVILTFFVAIKMFLDINGKERAECSPTKSPLIISGLIVGFLTGFIGVGGGFLIVPALMLFAGLNIKKAVGTSVFIILTQVIVSLFSYSIHQPDIFYSLPISELALIGGIGGVGALIGTITCKNIEQVLLSRIFASMLIVVSIVMTVVKLV